MTDPGAVCGIVLAGGRSTRMGRDKATMPWRESTMLGTVVDTLRSVLPQVIVVAAQGQDLPAVAARIVRDPVPGEGPLRGLATGLAAAAEDGYVWAFAAATDTPLLSTAVVRRLLVEAGDVDMVLATTGGRDQPLIAAYRTALTAGALSLLERGRRGLRDLGEGRAVRRVDLGADGSAVNINTPADVELARLRAGRRDC